MDLSSIGRHIKEARLQKSWKQEQLGEAVGLSTPYIGAIERSEKIPKLETFIRIINVLGISADVVLEDVTKAGYRVRMSGYLDKMDGLSREKREKIFRVIEVMIEE